MDYIFYVTKNDGLPVVLFSSDDSDAASYEVVLKQIPFIVSDYVSEHSDKDYEFVLQLHR